MGNWKLCALLVNIKWCSHCGKQYDDSSKHFKIELSWSSSPTSIYISQRMKSRDMKRDLQTHVHSGIDHNSQEVGAPKGSLTDEWTNETWYIHTVEWWAFLVAPTERVLFSFKKEDRFDKCYNMNEPWEQWNEPLINWNKPITKRHVLYDSIMWVTWGGHIHRNGKSSGGYQGLGEGETGSCYLMSIERWKSSGD